MISGMGIDWTNVLVALIAGLPAIIAAVGVLFLHRAVRTPSGVPIGRQIEGAHHVAIANNQRLVSIGDRVGAVVSQLGESEEAQVPKLNDEDAERT